MPVKFVLNDTKTGKSYSKEVEDSKFKPLIGQKIGYEFDGGIIDIPGYKLKITGGSDKNGFPMRKGVHKNARARLFLSGGVGYNPKEKHVRRRKTIRGEIIGDDIAQLNVSIVKAGKQTIEQILGLVQEEAPAEADKATEEKKEEKA